MMRSETVSKKLASMKEVQIIEEALIPIPKGNLKPDLVVVNRGRVHVVDVTVRHEDTGYLDEGHKTKWKSTHHFYRFFQRSSKSIEAGSYHL